MSQLVRIKEEVFIFRREYFILGSVGELALRTKNKKKLLSKALLLSDERGNTLATIKQSFAFAVPKFNITLADGTAFSVKKKFSLGPDYEIVGLPWRILIDTSDFLYKFQNTDGSTIATIRKSKTSISSSYSVEVFEKSELASSIALTIALDLCCKLINKT